MKCADRDVRSLCLALAYNTIHTHTCSTKLCACASVDPFAIVFLFVVVVVDGAGLLPPRSCIRAAAALTAIIGRRHTHTETLRNIYRHTHRDTHRAVHTFKPGWRRTHAELSQHTCHPTRHANRTHTHTLRILRNAAQDQDKNNATDARQHSRIRARCRRPSPPLTHTNTPPV